MYAYLLILHIIFSVNESEMKYITLFSLKVKGISSNRYVSEGLIVTKGECVPINHICIA